MTVNYNAVLVADIEVILDEFEIHDDVDYEDDDDEDYDNYDYDGYHLYVEELKGRV